MTDNQCTFCGQAGHRASHCPRRDAWDGIRDEDRKALALVALVCLTAMVCGLLALGLSLRGGA